MERSESELRAAIAANPGDLESEMLLGILCTKTRRFAEGADRLQRIVRLQPNNFDALIWLANAKKGLRDFDAAIAICHRAIAVSPRNAIGHHTLGQCLLGRRSGGAAVEAFLRAIELDPKLAPAHHSLGNAYILEVREKEAIDAFRKVVEVAPGDIQGYMSLSEQLLKHGSPDEAVSCLEMGRKVFPASAPLLAKLARAYAMALDAPKAEKFYRMAISCDPSFAAAYGLWLQEEGRSDESAEAFRQSIEVQPRQGYAYFGVVQAKPEWADDEMRATMRALASDPQLHVLEKMYLAYAGAKLDEREGDYESAIAQYDRANEMAFRIYNAGRGFDQEQQTAMVDRVISEFEGTPPDLPSSPSDQPIFIVGMIRSGTTLLDQMISAHSLVESAGEMRFWLEEGARRMAGTGAGDLPERYLKELNRWGRGAHKITDKMPLNYTHLGLIHKSLPNARIIHIRRNPLDTCLSIYTTFLGGAPYFAYRKENIVFYYRKYLRLIEFWRRILPADRLLEIDYEALVSDPEPVMRQVMEFCGLPWEPACLSPEQNRSAIHTPSLWQARGPIVTSSVERWRRYEPWLGEFEELRAL